MSRQPSPPLAEFIRKGEAVQLLRVSKKSFARYVEAGRIAVFEPEFGFPRYSRADCERIMREAIKPAKSVVATA